MSTFFVLVHLAALVFAIFYLVKFIKAKKAGDPNTNDPKLKMIGAIVVWFIAFILVGITAPDTKEQTEEAAVETSTEASTIEAKEEVATEASTEASTEPEKETPSEPTEFEVTLDVTSRWDGDKVAFDIKTNLPDEAVLMLTLSNGDYNTSDKFSAQTKVTIKDGAASSEGFSNSGKKLTGDFDLSVSMSLPSTQSDAVQAVIGKNGEYMTGNLVEKASIGDNNVVKALYNISIGEDITVTPTDDYTNTTFRDEDSDASNTESSLTDEEHIKMLVAASEVILKQNFGSDYEIKYEDKVVTINVWKDGIAAGALGVQAGTVSKSDWNTMVSGIESMSKSVYETFEPYGVSVNVNVLNDLNKDNTLLSFLNGVKFYDAVE